MKRTKEYKPTILIYGVDRVGYQVPEVELKEVCKYKGEPTGIILRNREYFIPTLRPEEYEIEKFFKFLADSLISSYKKLSD